MGRIADMIARTETRLNQYIAAETAVLQSQSYTIGNRTLTRANLSHIESKIDELEKKLIKLDRGGGIRVQKVVFRDNR